MLTLRIFISPDAKTLELPEKRGDLDNYIKAIVDGLQYGGIFAPKAGNKKGNDKVVIRYGEGTGIYIDANERVELTLEEISHSG
jgi:Holliday junction resolvase RusA-like endonuclease